MARPDRGRVTNLSRLVYPVYTVYRNKFPRPAGQGASLIERLFTGISGSQTGGQSVADISLSELVGGSSFGTWPLNLPAAGHKPKHKSTYPTSSSASPSSSVARSVRRTGL